MAYLNINIPQIECFVRGAYLKNLEAGHGETYPCVVFGFASIPNRAPLFHFMMEDGGVWWRMPIQAFCSRPDAEPSDGYEQVLWDSFSYYPSVTTFTAMLNKRIEFVGRSGRHHAGQYLFTLDWAHEDRNIIDPGCAEMPGQHKMRPCDRDGQRQLRYTAKQPRQTVRPVLHDQVGPASHGTQTQHPLVDG